MKPRLTHRHPGPCPNCGHELAAVDNFCSNCGQENHELKVPIGHLLYETVEGIFHFDNKFFSTIRAGLFSPGKLTVDFLEGRRARYVPPIRLYVFVAFLLSLLLSFIPMQDVDMEANGANLKMNTGATRLKDRLVKKRVRYGIAGMPATLDLGSKASQVRLIKTAATQLRNETSPQDTTRLDAISSDSLVLCDEIMSADDSDDDTLVWRSGRLVLVPRITHYPIDSAGLAILHTKNQPLIDSMAKAWGAWPLTWQRRLALKRIARISEGKNSLEGTAVKADGLVKTFFKVFFASMFILMPLVAFMLWVLYRKTRPYYYEHLIFSVHTHAIIFLILSLFLGADFLASNDGVSQVLLAAMAIAVIVYFPIALRRVYPSTWPRYWAKLFVLSILYTSVMLTFMAFGIVFSALTF